MSGSPSDISDCRAEGRRSSHVVDLVDFLLILVSLNWIDFSFLYLKNTLVHMEDKRVLSQVILTT